MKCTRRYSAYGTNFIFLLCVCMWNGVAVNKKINRDVDSSLKKINFVSAFIFIAITEVMIFSVMIFI